MRSVLVPGLVALLVALATSAPPEAGEPDPIVGEWTLVTALRGRDVESHLTIARGEDGALSGTYTDHRDAKRPLEGLSFEDGVLRFTRTMGPRRVPFEGKVSGDRIVGAHRLGEREIAAWGARGTEAVAALRAERMKATERGDDLEADYEKHSRRAAPRDAFPVLFDPNLAPASEAYNVQDDEPVIGVALGGEAKAYPISIMGRHELANDTCGGEPIAASW
jgi:hypothetical protein